MAEKKDNASGRPPHAMAGLMEHSLEELVYAKLGVFFEKLGNGEENVYEILVPQFERPLIRLALEVCGGNKCDAAKLLGMNRNTLLARMKSYGMPTQPRFWRRKPE